MAMGIGAPPARLRRVDRYAPDGTTFPHALARARRLAVVAHPDDAELMVLSAIARGVAGEPFALVVCTDGAGAPTRVADPRLAARRRAEQRRAAELGGYAALLQLGYTSGDACGGAHAALTGQLAAIIARAAPDELLTHTPTDRHPTHVAVAVAAVTATRRLPAGARPGRVLGFEVWGGLDWLTGAHRVTADASGARALGRRVLGAHRSQLAGKAYDRAAEGRRAANATFAEPRSLDTATALELAFDLTPATRDGGPTLGALVEEAFAAAAAAARGPLRDYGEG